MTSSKWGATRSKHVAVNSFNGSLSSGSGASSSYGTLTSAADNSSADYTTISSDAPIVVIGHETAKSMNGMQPYRQQGTATAPATSPLFDCVNTSRSASTSMSANSSEADHSLSRNSNNSLAAPYKRKEKELPNLPPPDQEAESFDRSRS